ncbi:MAG: hypothetical protein JSV45_10835 [Chromatiales bacterium]|nr:MAG: hypothetical protein JSV45_10835 [Chromatiales bacterium]
MILNKLWRRLLPGLAIAAALSLVAQAALAGAHSAGESMDHSKMDHSGQSMMSMGEQRDEKGRRLYGMKHNITPEIANELRENVPLFATYSDAELNLSMEMMGSNYEWYLSEANVSGDQGLLLLMHGFRERGDAAFKKNMQPMASIFPTAMAAGMSMMMSDHIQWGVKDLEAAGVQTIVVVPIVSTRYNTMMRQWQYILGQYPEPSYASVAQVQSDARILIADPPGDDPLIAEILLDHAMDISEGPEQEVVVIAAHGPSFDEDNQKVLAELANLAKIVREDGDFADVMAITLQDDAPTEIRERNVAKLRSMVEQATAGGKQVLIVTNLIGTRTIQAKLRDDLKGLNYRFNKNGIVSHDNFMKWMGETVRQELERNKSASTAAAN